MTNIDLELKSLAPIAVEILFCQKKIATESGIKLLKNDFGETVSLKYCAIKNPKSYDFGF